MWVHSESNAKNSRSKDSSSFMCDQCDHMAITKGNLKLHRDFKHNESTLYYCDKCIHLTYNKRFTDKGSNDEGSNDTGSNDIGSNDTGSNDKGSKVRQRVKRQKVKMIKIFFDLNHRKLAFLIPKIRKTFLKI